MFVLYSGIRKYLKDCLVEVLICEMGSKSAVQVRLILKKAVDGIKRLILQPLNKYFMKVSSEPS